MKFKTLFFAFSFFIVVQIQSQTLHIGAGTTGFETTYTPLSGINNGRESFNTTFYLGASKTLPSSVHLWTELQVLRPLYWGVYNAGLNSTFGLGERLQRSKNYLGKLGIGYAFGGKFEAIPSLFGGILLMSSPSSYSYYLDNPGGTYLNNDISSETKIIYGGNLQVQYHFKNRITIYTRGEYRLGTERLYEHGYEAGLPAPDVIETGDGYTRALPFNMSFGVGVRLGKEE